MNFNEYRRKCKLTLCYKREEEKIACSALEIVDEVAEFLEHYFNGSDENLILSEMGDITYPMAILSLHYKISLEEIDTPFASNKPTVGNMEANLIDDGLFCAGKIAGVMKKTIRDDAYELTDTKDRRTKLIFYLNSMYTYLTRYCAVKKINLSDILVMNIEKLLDRKERGVLQGDGDKR